MDVMRRVATERKLLLMVAASAGVLGAVAWTAPPPIALPLLSAAFAVLAAAAALVAWSGREAAAASITYWDISGALCLFSASAAIMGEPEHLVAFLETRSPD